MGNSVFNKEDVNKATVFGFQYKPGQAPVFEPIKENATGLIVGIRRDELGKPATFFQDLSDKTSILRAIYALPTDIDARWKELLKTVNTKYAEDDNTLKLTQGFLTYTYQCLEYLYRIANARTVLDGICQSQKSVYILPSHMGNQITGASTKNSFPPLAFKILNPSSRFTRDDGLVDLAHAKYKGENPNASLGLMATAMNSMPLYSLFKTAPYEFTPDENTPTRGFLGQSNHSVTDENLVSWFTEGNKSIFASGLQNGMTNKINEVSIQDYIRLAVLIALGDDMPAGKGSGTVTVNFNTKYHQVYLPQSRPPAIGLGHELVHAYWAINGRQLGQEIGHYSTLLFELKCVGLGPWLGKDISDNGIRAGWATARQAGGMDNYNNIAAPNRNIYEVPEPDNSSGRSKARKKYKTI